jgi:hypothetical protein
MEPSRSPVTNLHQPWTTYRLLFTRSLHLLGSTVNAKKNAGKFIFLYSLLPPHGFTFHSSGPRYLPHITGHTGERAVDPRS